MKRYHLFKIIFSSAFLVIIIATLVRANNIQSEGDTSQITDEQQTEIQIQETVSESSVSEGILTSEDETDSVYEKSIKTYYASDFIRP